MDKAIKNNTPITKEEFVKILKKVSKKTIRSNYKSQTKRRKNIICGFSSNNPPSSSAH
jgi:hypothetical protein